VAMGLFIRNLARIYLEEKLRIKDIEMINKRKFSGVYFTNIFYGLLENTVDGKEILINIEAIECSNPKIWTTMNIKPFVLGKENINKKAYELDEKNEKLDDYFPNGFICQINKTGKGTLFSARLENNVNDNNIDKRKATCTGLILALVSKDKDIDGGNKVINWSWNLKNIGTSLNIESFKTYLPERFHNIALKLTLSDFFYLCSILAIIFDLEHIDMFCFSTEEQINPRTLIGIRDIVYK
jgi:hypothetical protein